MQTRKRARWPGLPGVMSWAMLLSAMLSGPLYADTIVARMQFKDILPATGVVYVPDEKAEVRHGRLDQKDKAFSAPMVVVSPKSELLLENSDPFQHNIFVDDKKTGVAFDLGMMAPQGKASVPVRWQTDSLLRIGCKIHPKMKAHVANIQSSHYAVVVFSPDRKEYQVEIRDVPEKLREVRVLLPDMPPLVALLEAGQAQDLEMKVRDLVVGKAYLSRQRD